MKRTGPNHRILLTLMLLVLGGMGAAAAGRAQSSPTALIPDIEIQPSGSVMVGEEVLLDATNSTFDDPELLQKARFEWDFGDGYVLQYGYPIYYSMDSGIATTHFFMRPGSYTVTLTVSIWDQFDSGDQPVGDPIAVESTSAQITVTGQDPQLPPLPAADPILDLMMDGNLNDNSPSGLSAGWQAGPGAYSRGMAGQAAALDTSAYITVTDPAGVMHDLNQLTISFWAKKNADEAYGYLLEKPGSFYIYISDPRTVRASVTTQNGTVNATSYLAYTVDAHQWNHYAFSYDGAILRLFLNGRELATQPQTGTVANSAEDLLIGKRASAADIFDGWVDELRIYPQALTLDELFTGFEVQHAPYYGRNAQYLYVQIPGLITREPSNQLKVTLDGDAGYATTLVEKAYLAGEEKVLLNNSLLPAGNYTLTAQLLTSGNLLLEQIQETFNKPYAGPPQIGIDENNALRVDGEPFFPVTPWLLNTSNMQTWKENGYINTLFAEGWYPEHTPATWSDYLTNAATHNLYAIGPERALDQMLPDIDLDIPHKRHFARNGNIHVFNDYISGTHTLPALMSWMWLDEPDLGGRGYRVPPPVLSAWTYASHQYDPLHHPVATNFTGYNWLPYWGPYGIDYDYYNSLAYFGGKKHFTIDIGGFDIYPLEYREHVTLNDPERGVMDLYAEAIDRAIARNGDLIPFMSFIEVCDIDEARQTPGPTAEQVLMEAWLNVVHGIKGINWFHYFEYDTIQYDAMAQFTDQITRLAPAVLSPETDWQVTDNANSRSHRVDTMIREYDGQVYLFAVRVTEPDPLPFEEQNFPEPESIYVTFNIENLGDSLAQVFDESRTIPVYNGSFSDSFVRNAVHIYQITPEALALHGRGADETIYLDWTVNVTETIDSWLIEYYTQTVTAPYTATEPLSASRSYTLTGLENYQWYTVTLHAIVGETPWLNDTVRVLTTDRFVYLPLVVRD